MAERPERAVAIYRVWFDEPPWPELPILFGVDIIQQRQLFKRSELQEVFRVGQAIRQRDGEMLENCHSRDQEITLAILDWTMRDAEDLRDAGLVEWCLTQDSLLRERSGGAQEYADAYAARLAWRRGVLRPIVGAGVSQAAGLPGWGALVGRCLARAEQETRDAQTLARLSAVRTALDQPFIDDQAYGAALTSATELVARVTGAQFVKVVREALRENFPIQADGVKAPTSEVHCALADMALHGALGPGLSGVVTYNFDELLEVTLMRHYGGARVHSSFDGRWHAGFLDKYAATTPIEVWHPHGFVPQFPLPPIGTPDIVFTEEAYERNYGKDRTFAVQVHEYSLAKSVCLFVGSSFTDRYQCAQVELAHQRQPGWFHYAILRLPKELRHRSQKYLSAEEYDSTSRPYITLGIRPLWINDFNVLPSAISLLSRPPLVQIETASPDYCSGIEAPSVQALYGK